MIPCSSILGYLYVSMSTVMFIYRYMFTGNPLVFSLCLDGNHKNGRTSTKVKERRAHTLGSLKKRKVSCEGRRSGPAFFGMGGNGDGDGMQRKG